MEYLVALIAFAGLGYVIYRKLKASKDGSAVGGSLGDGMNER